MNNISSLLDNLWACYAEMNSQVPAIHQALIQAGEQNIQNDHIAFRAFEGGKLGINKLKAVFEELGWQQAGQYHFKQKKLQAIHLEHDNAELPKIFISELITSEFSKNLQDIVSDDLLELSDDFFSGCWLTKGRWQSSLPDLAKYEQLLQESEYAAWLYIFGICPNHFTVYVNALEKFANIDSLNEFLLANNFTMNTSGGLVKGAEQDGLRQSSTMASKVAVEFKCGKVKSIPCCYYEFAERFMLSGKLFQGFVTGSADKIFQSTDVSGS